MINTSEQNDPIIISFLDERHITSLQKGGLRDWLCPSHCMAEKVLWQECIPDELYKRYGPKESTLMLLQPKLGQICDLIRSSEYPKLIDICIEGRISGKNVFTNKPHRSAYYVTPRMNLQQEKLSKLRSIILEGEDDKIPETLLDIFIDNLNVEFPNMGKGNVIELLASKVYFNH